MGGCLALTLADAAHVSRVDFILWLAPIVQVAWVFAFGACIGSLLNVLVYRLPLGLDVVTPTSRCPSCETPLTWRENIPIFGWLALRGRCRFCRSPISAEYPIVEAATALLWVVVYLVLYADEGRFLGIPFGALRPEWAAGGFRETWPIFILIVSLFSCLIAVTLIDARTFHIPMSLVIVPVVMALLIHPALAAWVQTHAHHGTLLRSAKGWEWAIATPGPDGWAWVGAAAGGSLGLLASNLLLHFGVLKRSFADYEDWLKQHAAPPAGTTGTGPDAPAPQDPPPQDSPELWTQYPHARREMFRELIFLGPCIGLAFLGSALAIRWAAPWTPDPLTGGSTPAVAVPLWLSVLTGVLMGYLIGGGVVWGMRLLGSLAFGKEALGLGDVHLMAAVGACLGWVDATLGFFGAAFVGVAWAVLGRAFSGVFRRHMPFGPYLAIATVLVWFFKPGVEALVSRLGHLKPPLDLP